MELDEDELAWELDSAIADAVALLEGIDFAAASRRQMRAIGQAIREVTVLDPDDGPVRLCEALEDQGVTILPGILPGASVAYVAAYTRPCEWPGCLSQARPPGRRGPRPRHCDSHRAEHKRAINHHPRNPRVYAPCCLTHQAAGGTGKCVQHRKPRKRPAKSRAFPGGLPAGFHVEGSSR